LEGILLKIRQISNYDIRHLELRQTDVGVNYWGLLVYRILELKCKPNLDYIINNLEYLGLALNNVNSHNRINSNNNNIAYNLDI